MALLHRATIAPTKGELVAAWLPTRPWAPAGPIGTGVSYRLDDPAGEVGLEAFLLTDREGGTVHIPLSYRAQPLAGAEDHLLGTMEHSVLGRRWVYDACGDPVYAAVLAGVISSGAGEAEEYVDQEGGARQRETTTHVRGTGDLVAAPVTALLRVDENDPTRIVTDAVELAVVRVLGDGGAVPLGPALTGTWPGRPEPVLLARARPASAA